jgi:uncharacterized protein
VDKRAFIKSVRNWEASVVEKALSREPQLAASLDQIGKTPLHHCAGINPREALLPVRNSIKTATALIGAGADVNAVRVISDEGEEFLATVLWYAVAWGKNIELARFLLENKAHPDNNSIRSAIWDQDLKMAELLISFGADVDPVVGKETPLLQVIRAKRLQLLEWLIDNGADINFQDREGYTALHHAVKGTHTLAQVKELLKYGASPALKAKDGSSPISLARAKGKTKLVALLAAS